MSAFDIVLPRFPMDEQRSNKADPKVRADGKCARVGCGKTIKISRRKDVPYEEYLKEPFCSTDCAREFHGVVRPMPKTKTGRPLSYT
jgi:hypothetical protein